MKTQAFQVVEIEIGRSVVAGLVDVGAKRGERRVVIVQEALRGLVQIATEQNRRQLGTIIHTLYDEPESSASMPVQTRTESLVGV